MNRFDYVKYDETAYDKQADAKQLMLDTERMINSVGGSNPSASARAKACAITKLEECYMWIGKMIRDDQVARLGTAEPQEERKNG